MPKFFVQMNIVEAKTTNFIVNAKDENDVYDALGELDGSYFEKNLKWVISAYESPEIDTVAIVSGKTPKTLCTKDQTNKLQRKFDRIITTFEKMEAAGDE